MKVSKIEDHTYIQEDRPSLVKLSEEEIKERTERNNNGFLSQEEFRKKYRAWEDNYYNRSSK